MDICNSNEVAVKGLQTDIAAVKSELNTTTGALQLTINLQEERLAAVSAKKTSDGLAEMEVSMSALKGEIRALQIKCEDLENRSRRNNLKMVGIAEGEEGKAPTAFISNLLKDLFGLEDLPLIDRAHRLGQVKPNTGQPPRPFILRAHFFDVKEQIIRLAREKVDLTYERKGHTYLWRSDRWRGEEKSGFQ